jgi:hypothetical protein
MNDRSKHSSGHLAAKLGELTPTRFVARGGKNAMGRMEAILQVAPNKGRALRAYQVQWGQGAYE